MTADNPLDAQADPFRPPAISTVVHCIHCDEEYDSYRIEWRVEKDSDGQPHGFWCCPIENCDGVGFGFDIFPVDPDYCDEHGNKMWMDDGEDEDEEGDDEDFDAGPDHDPPSSTGSHDSSEYENPNDDNPLPW